MKLYEFTYLDNQNLSKTRLLHRIDTFLANEAVTQSWASGYSFRQFQEPESTEIGTTYYFEVLGKYLDSEGIESDSEQDDSALEDTPINPAAASEVEY